jgi:hypothetical protein
MTRSRLALPPFLYIERCGDANSIWETTFIPINRYHETSSIMGGKIRIKIKMSYFVVSLTQTQRRYT